MTLRMLVSIVAFATLLVQSLTVLAHGGDDRHTNIKGIPVTGPNDLCGEGVLALPPPLPINFSGRFVGEHDPRPGATDALPLTPDNCDDPDILLASTTDPDLQAFAGFPDADPRVKNFPLRQTPIIVAPNGLRQSVPGPGVLPPNPFPPTRSAPNDPITLGQWLSVKSKMRIRCTDNGLAHVNAQFRNLIPNGVYSMWAVWLATPPGAPGQTIVPLPFGGVPNVVVADGRGRLTFQRELTICPFDRTPDGSELMFADLLYHSDGAAFGAVPEKPLDTVDFQLPDGSMVSTVLAGGIVTHDQVIFPITVERLRD